jgi:polyisoprenoid-binding protein YceI
MTIRSLPACLLALAAMPVFGTSYTSEPDHAQGVFRWNHLGFSNPAGQFSQAKGSLKFDPAEPGKSTVEVTIALSTLQTGLPELDEVLRSVQFFDTATFPTATFKSNAVREGAKPGEFAVAGDLNLHGVTKPATLDVTLVKIGKNPRNGLPTIGFDATTTIKRSAFNLGAFIPQVGDDIPMRIIIEAVETQAYEKYLEAEAAKKN